MGIEPIEKDNPANTEIIITRQIMLLRRMDGLKNIGKAITALITIAKLTQYILAPIHQ